MKKRYKSWIYGVLSGYRFRRAHKAHPVLRRLLSQGDSLRPTLPVKQKEPSENEAETQEEADPTEDDPLLNELKEKKRFTIPR